MTHDELVDEITKRCDEATERAGSGYLWWFHANDHPRNRRGWVDLVILGPHGALFVEVKSADGRRTMAQIRCAERLTRVGFQYRLWHPSDLADGIIDRELKAIQ